MVIRILCGVRYADNKAENEADIVCVILAILGDISAKCRWILLQYGAF